MANKTLSGKLAAIDPAAVASNADNIAGNMKAAKSLYRFVGIVDKVAKVETANMAMSGHSAADNSRILLTGQTTATENGVYQVSGGNLTRVNHSLEAGNLVEDMENADSSKTVFWKYADGDNWSKEEFIDGAAS
ncbi:hypothetical protein [Spongorhabdus nitratireducens]